MTRKINIICLLVISIGFISCIPRPPATDENTKAPTQGRLEETQTPAAALGETPIPTHTKEQLAETLESVEALTSTAAPTLEADQAEAAILDLLLNPEDCVLPCLWTIHPGETTIEQAQTLFSYLALTLEQTSEQGKNIFYGSVYDLSDGTEITHILTVVDGTVKNLRMYIVPSSEQMTTPQDWSILSPDKLIQNHGAPSQVLFAIDPGRPQIYAMSMFFEESGFIVQYTSKEVGLQDSAFRICPVTNRVDTIQIWSGEEPYYPPTGVPLEEAADLSIDEFGDLITEDPNSACIELTPDAFK